MTIEERNTLITELNDLDARLNKYTNNHIEELKSGGDGTVQLFCLITHRNYNLMNEDYDYVLQKKLEIRRIVVPRFESWEANGFGELPYDESLEELSTLRDFRNQMRKGWVFWALDDDIVLKSRQPKETKTSDDELYDLPSLLGYKTGASITRGLKGSNLTNLKPYKKLTKAQVISILEVLELAKSKQVALAKTKEKFGLTIL